MALPTLLPGNRNIVPASIVTASSARAGYPANNMRNSAPSLAWRSNDAGFHGILIDHLRAESVDAVALINCNIRNVNGGTVVLKRGDTIDCVDVTEELTPDADDIFKLITPSRLRYSKLELNDFLNEDGYYEIGHIWLGSRLNLTYGLNQYFTHLDVQINSENTIAAGGMQVEHLYEQVCMSLTFEGLASWEATALADLWQELRGASIPAFFIPDRSTAEGYWCRISSMKQTKGTATSFQVELEELSRGD